MVPGEKGRKRMRKKNELGSQIMEDSVLTY